MAHALLHYDGLCKNIHGHSYHLEVTIKGNILEDETSPKNGMVMDFGELKQIVESTIVNKIDHALVVHRKSDESLIAQLQKHYEKIVLVDYQPTTENMLVDFACQLKAVLPSHLTLYSLKLSETDSSFSEWVEE
jgi:6-pyruvoyltetrahydropterin/6-carboxytetrahydropterin synthase